MHEACATLSSTWCNGGMSGKDCSGRVAIAITGALRSLCHITEPINFAGSSIFLPAIPRRLLVILLSTSFHPPAAPREACRDLYPATTPNLLQR